MRGPDTPVGGRRRASQTSMPAQDNARAGIPHRGEPQRFSLANWSVSSRLAALCAMASVLGLVFGGLRISDAVDTSQAYAHTVQLAVVGSKITALAQAMEDERDRATGFMTLTMLLANAHADHAGPQVLASIKADLNQQNSAWTSAKAVTNVAAESATAAVRGIGSGFPASIQSKAANVLTQIAYVPSISGLRDEVTQSGEQPIQVIDSYSGVLSILFALDNEITTGSGDVVLGDDVRALGALSQAEDQASQQRAILYGALLDSALNDAGSTQATGFNNVGGPTALSNFGGLDAFITAQDLQFADQQAFQAVATTAQTQAFLSATGSPTAGNAQLIENLVTTAGDPTVIFPLGQGLQGPQGLGFIKAAGAPAAWYNDMSAIIDGMRGVDNQLASAIVARGQLLQHQAFESVVVTAVAVALAVLLVLLATTLVARSMVNPLRRLQREALEIATVKLPQRIAAAARGAELAEADPAAFNRVEPIGVQGTDEIGRVARAFDQVHAEAVRLAGTEAQLRSNLNAMFISLSRRSVPLIDRLTRMIDNLEQNEDDPDQLSHLFSMDHLVTRMRRNSENLLVLAGEEPVRKWSEPVPLTDVARAAAAEIEQYGRVALTVQPGVMVSGQAVADVVHLLAELLENATLFSPRNTQVQVAAADAPGGGVLIEIRDEGVGVSTSRLAEMNWRLDHPPGVDVSVSRHMGLFAVSRLAARRGIRVRLRAGAPQGLTALVWLPGTLTSSEQPVAVGLHSRLQVEGVALAEDMVFAQAATRRRQPAALGVRQARRAAPLRPARLHGPRGGRPLRSRVRSRRQRDGAADSGYAPAGSGRVAAGSERVAAGSERVAAGEQRAQRSVWFAAKTPSSPQARGGADEQSPSPTGNGRERADADWGAAGRLAAGAHYAGAYSAELAARAAGDGQGGVPSQLPQTPAGLPMRVPLANTGPAGRPARYDASPDDASVLGAPPGAGAHGARSPFSTTGGQRQVTQQAPRRRSPEAARNRVAGFQLGSRDAAQTGNGGWAAFSRGDEPPAWGVPTRHPAGPPYPPPQPR